MKKKFFGITHLIFLLMLCLVLSACTEDPKLETCETSGELADETLNESTAPEDIEAEEPPVVPAGGYTFSFESNVDGTCNIVGLLVDYDAKNLTLEIPEFSPAGERVVSYEVGRSVQWWQNFNYSHVPYLITKADFDERIATPLKKALDEGKINTFKYEAFLTEFQLQDLSTVTNEKAKEQIKQLYPIVSLSPIYVMKAHADSGQYTVSDYLTQYANFTEQDCFEVTQNIWKLCKEANLPCKLTYVRDTNAITSVSFPEGLKTVNYYSFAGMTGFDSVILPDRLTEIGLNAFEQSGIQQIVIPKGVTKIEANALSSDALKSIYYCGTAEEWAKLAYQDYKSQVTVYCYSENPPTASGSYWHYVEGKPISW